VGRAIRGYTQTEQYVEIEHARVCGRNGPFQIPETSAPTSNNHPFKPVKSLSPHPLVNFRHDLVVDVEAQLGG
jgi:hypothetical protein